MAAALSPFATLNEPDNRYKRVLVKEEGADAERVRVALEAADVEVIEIVNAASAAFA